jgi:hypothetical protein
MSDMLERKGERPASADWYRTLYTSRLTPAVRR